MGSKSSKNSNCSNKNYNWDLAKQNADKIYNYRIKNYKQMIHGPMQVYMIQVESEYELECIPLGLRGNNH
jgi:hypothetical protein